MFSSISTARRQGRVAGSLEGRRHQPEEISRRVKQRNFGRGVTRIARNKLNDHYPQQSADRMQPMPPEDLWQMMELSAQDAPMTAADRHDLEYAMKLLTASKPECSDLLWKHYVIGLDYARDCRGTKPELR